MSIPFSDASEHLIPIRSKASTPHCLPTFLALMLTSFISIQASSASFEDGLDAAKRGDYVSALKEFVPLAEQGDAEVQYILGFMYEDGLGVRTHQKLNQQEGRAYGEIYSPQKNRSGF